MGEVYRAHDTRLQRDVAVKVVHPARASAEYVERLTREARAASALNHPNIVAVFDVGTEGTIPYVVSELLEGASLRQRIDRGPIALRKALEYGIDVAQALGAAHEKGICHRDVKPANIFITTDGRVKLLDFGLAEVERRRLARDPDDSTAPTASRPLLVSGTVGYMAPEQVRGEAVDHRADIFALGAVLYEMFTGARAFHRSTPTDTQVAVLTEDPPDPLEVNPALPPAAAVVLRRCLEKSKEERFQSARDLAFNLRQIEQTGTGARRAARSAFRDHGRLLAVALGLAATAATLVIAYGVLRPRPGLAFQQLTFHRGRIGGARFFAPGIVYSQAIEDKPPRVWSIASNSTEAISTNYNADVLASRGDALALSVGRRFAGGERFIGTLAEVTSPGQPRSTEEDVEDADWDALSGAFAVARSRGLRKGSQLEFPVGRVLRSTKGSILFPRISRDGRRVAFLEDAGGVGNKGRVMVAERDGTSRALTPEWASARGLAWSPRGDEIWFAAAAEARGSRALRAVDLEGRQRLLLESASPLTLWDAASDGRVLLTRDDERRTLTGAAPGDTVERDLSMFDDAGLAAVSLDGSKVLFSDRFGVYVRPTTGEAAMRLAAGKVYPDDLSPDGKWVLAETTSGDQLLLLPTGPGTSRVVPTSGVASFSGARWFPSDPRRILFNGCRGDRPLRSYVMDLAGGPPSPLTSEDTWVLSISVDGKLAAATGDQQGITIWPTDGRPRWEVPGSEPGERPVAWSEDSSAVWTFRRDRIPTDIYRVDVVTGRRQLSKRLAPRDLNGVYSINEVQMTPSGNAYFYSYRRIVSELYLVTGLR
jgi:hypothetical protein